MLLLWSVCFVTHVKLGGDNGREHRVGLGGDRIGMDQNILFEMWNNLHTIKIKKQWEGVWEGNICVSLVG